MHLLILAGLFGLIDMATMKDNKLFKIGITGTVIAALCCFTPLLVILLTAIGLAGVIGFVDYVAIPLLVLFAGLTVYALFRHLRR